MVSIVYSAILVATGAAVARTIWVLAGFLRTLTRPRSSVDIRWDLPVLIVAPEVVLTAIAALWSFYGRGAAPPYSSWRAAFALVGAGLALGGVALTVWSWVSLPSVGTGHYLLEGQPLVTKGAYGAVRHPIYAGAFLIWFGLAAAYASKAILILTIMYVIPAYLLNIREEEKMMLSRYGDEYRAYRRRAGAFVPRIARRGLTADHPTRPSSGPRRM